MKKIGTNIERYDLENGYILEVWEEQTKRGLMFDFWLQQTGTAYKLNMFGWPADQTQANEPRVFSKEDAIQLALANIDEYIKMYAQDIEESE